LYYLEPENPLRLVYETFDFAFWIPFIVLLALSFFRLF